MLSLSSQTMASTWFFLQTEIMAEPRDSQSICSRNGLGINRLILIKLKNE